MKVKGLLALGLAIAGVTWMVKKASAAPVIPVPPVVVTPPVVGPPIDTPPVIPPAVMFKVGDIVSPVPFNTPAVIAPEAWRVEGIFGMNGTFAYWLILIQGHPDSSRPVSGVILNGVNAITYSLSPEDAQSWYLWPATGLLPMPPAPSKFNKGDWISPIPPNAQTLVEPELWRVDGIELIDLLQGKGSLPTEGPNGLYTYYITLMRGKTIRSVSATMVSTLGSEEAENWYWWPLVVTVKPEPYPILPDPPPFDPWSYDVDASGSISLHEYLMAVQDTNTGKITATDRDKVSWLWNQTR